MPSSLTDGQTEHLKAVVEREDIPGLPHQQAIIDIAVCKNMRGSILEGNDDTDGFVGMIAGC